jgi:two-component system, chemotaxis family, sensor kinase CheA
MGESVLSRRSILIVDDDVRNTFALVSYLETLDMKIFTAEHGMDALTILHQHDHIEVVLIDISMPVMDGYEAMRKMKENSITADIPVIAVTARAMKGDREKCLKAGASDYISKPVNLAALLEKMERLISVSKNSNE